MNAGAMSRVASTNSSSSSTVRRHRLCLCIRSSRLDVPGEDVLRALEGEEDPRVISRHAARAG